MILPFVSVPNTGLLGKFVIVIPPFVVPSTITPVVLALLPSLVRNTFWIYCTALGAITPTSNALAINKIHDIHKKNNVAHFIKLMLFFFVWRFLLVKLMITD